MKLFDPKWIYKDLTFIVAVPMVVNVYQILIGVNGIGPYWAAATCGAVVLFLWYLDEK